MINYKNKLDSNQYDAVVSNIQGNKICIASAGTGKTFTLTHRIAYLVENGINPDNILLLTFTNKAANEMLNRTKQLLTDGEMEQNEFEITGGTFHHIAITLFYKYASLIDSSLMKYTVINPDDSEDILSYLRKNYIEDMVKVDKGYSLKELKADFPKAKFILKCISKAFNTNRRLQDILEEQDSIAPNYIPCVLKIENQYKKYKAKHFYYDFDDLLRVFLALLCHEKIGKIIKQRYPYVFVDEVQDINRIQYNIIKELEGNMFIVGDAKQAIYGFRGSNSEYINKRSTFFTGYQEFYLSFNYRSCKKIIEKANQFTDYFKADVAKSENLICTKDKDGYFHHQTLESGKEQTKAIIKTIKDVTALSPSDTIAILLRTNSQSRALETELIKNNITYEMLCGIPFFGRKHIRDILAFVKVIANPQDIISFQRVALLFPSVGAKTADKIYSFWKENQFNPEIIQKALGEGKGGLKEQSFLLTKLFLMFRNEDNVYTIIKGILDLFYKDLLNSKFIKEEAQEKIEDANGLLEIALEKDTVSKFIAHINLLEQNKLNDKSSKDITLLTIHKSKGLEFDHVLIPSVNEGIYPFGMAESVKEYKEEDNAFYVALTRARKALYLFTTLYDISWDGYHQTEPSRYLESFNNPLADSIIGII